jgi:hypothetical protein
MTKSQHLEDENPVRSLNQNNQISDDPADGHRLTDKPEATGKKTPAEQPPEQDQQGQATVEEFGEEGMGVAPKE